MAETLRVLVGVAILLASSSPVAADAPSRDELRTSIAADGKVTDGAMRERTGWQLVRAFEWSIELEDGANTGRFVAANPATPFRNGQRFRVAIEPYCDLYFYVLVQNADGSESLLLPELEQGEKPALIKKGQRVYLPPDGESFRFDPPAGTERLRLLASAEPLPWATAPELLQLKAGAELTTAQQSALAQLKDIRSRQARTVIKNRAQLAQVAGIANAVRSIDSGERARGVEVVILDKLPQGELVTYTSANPQSTAVLTHEIVLQHAD